MAAVWLKGSAPSMITWPPKRPSSLYNLAYSDEGLSDSKLVTIADDDSPSFKSERVEPTICLTLPYQISLNPRIK